MKISICDPNGDMMPGGCYEFVKMPLKRRIGKESTCIA